jgi:tyrosine-specific transport protein
MLATGLLFLEISLWLPKDANIVSMADHLLGKGGRVFSAMLYLFLFYCLTVAYTAGGGGFIVSLSGGALPGWAGILLFAAIFSPIVYFGTRAVDRINLIWMLGLALSYGAFVVMGAPKVDLNLLKGGQFSAALFAMPIIFTSFSFGGIIPSLITYLKRDIKMVRWSLFLGTSVPFAIYIIWQLLILGIIPVEGAGGLIEAKALGQSAVTPLKQFVNSSSVYAIGQVFSFFALTTSFLGVTLGLMDFIADGFKLSGVKPKKIVLFLVVFVPPTLIALSKPTVFLQALNYAGGIGCALLLGLLPVMMAWIGRYKRRMDPLTWQLPGGKILLIFLALFTFFELVIELFFSNH